MVGTHVAESIYERIALPLSYDGSLGPQYKPDGEVQREVRVKVEMEVEVGVKGEGG